MFTSTASWFGKTILKIIELQFQTQSWIVELTISLFGLWSMLSKVVVVVSLSEHQPMEDRRRMTMNLNVWKIKFVCVLLNMISNGDTHTAYGIRTHASQETKKKLFRIHVYRIECKYFLFTDTVRQEYWNK